LEFGFFIELLSKYKYRKMLRPFEAWSSEQKKYITNKKNQKKYVNKK
jgi:hypothetical protein